MSKNLEAKADHPKLMWVCFLRKKPKAEPEMLTVSAGALNALVLQEQLAKKANVPRRKVELVVYHAEDERYLLAEQLAEEGARSVIDAVVISRDVDGEEWLQIEAEDAESVADHLRYLELRGMVKRHASEPGFIQLKEARG